MIAEARSRTAVPSSPQNALPTGTAQATGEPQQHGDAPSLLPPLSASPRPKDGLLQRRTAEDDAILIRFLRVVGAIGSTLCLVLEWSRPILKIALLLVLLLLLWQLAFPLFLRLLSDSLVRGLALVLVLLLLVYRVSTK